MAGEQVRTFTWRGKDELSAIAKNVADGMLTTKQAGVKATSTLGAALASLGEEGARLAPAMDKIGKKFTDMGDLAEEGAQKIVDAQKKLTEFGGGAEDLAAGLEASIAASQKYGVSITRTSAALEELAIRTEDPKKAVQLLDKAMQIAQRTNLKAEDAADRLAVAYRGQTDALEALSGRGQRYATLLGKIRDPQLRAKEAVRLTNKELETAPSRFDKVSDKISVARVRLSEMAGGFDVLGGAVTAATGILAVYTAAIAAATKAAIDFGIESAKTFIEGTRQGSESVEILEKSLHRLKFATGDAIDGAVDLNTKMRTAASGMDFLRDTLDKNIKKFQFFVGGVDIAAKAMVLFTKSMIAALPQGDMVTRMLDTLGQEFDAFAEERRKHIEAEVKFKNLTDRMTASEIDNKHEIMRINEKLREGAELTAAEWERVRKQMPFFVDAIGDAMDRQSKDFEEFSKSLEKSAKDREKTAKSAARGEEQAAKGLFSALDKLAKQWDKEEKERKKEQEKRRKEAQRKFLEDHKERVKASLKEIKLQTDALKRPGELMAEGQRKALEGAGVTGARKITFEEAGITNAAEQLAVANAMAEDASLSFNQAQAKLRVGMGKGISELERQLVLLADVGFGTASMLKDSFVEITGAIGSGIASMTQQMVEGTFTIRKLGDMVLGGIGDIMISAGSNLILTGTLSLNPGLIAGGLALMAAGGALKGMGTKVGASGGGAGTTAGGGGTAATTAGATTGGRSDREAREAERLFPDERERRAFLRREEERRTNEQRRRDQMFRTTLLESVEMGLHEDRRRRRELDTVFQVFTGRILESRAQTDVRTQVNVNRLIRSRSLVSANGAPYGLVRRR